MKSLALALTGRRTGTCWWSTAAQGRLALKARQVHRVTRVVPVLQVLKVQLGRQDLQVPREQLGRRAHREQPVQQVLLVSLVHKVQQAPPVHGTICLLAMHCLALQTQ